MVGFSGAVFVGLVLGWLGVPFSLEAAPPAEEVAMPKGRPVCHVNRRALRARAARIRAQGLAAGPAVIGTRGVAVLHVQGAGQTARFNRAQAEALFQRVSDFFYENAYGVFTATFTVHGIYSLPHPMTYYGDDNEGILITDALAAAAAADFTSL